MAPLQQKRNAYKIAKQQFYSLDAILGTPKRKYSENILIFDIGCAIMLMVQECAN